MIDERLARDAIGLLSTAAAMLIEDAHDALVMRPADAASAAALASLLESLGADIGALGAAASVLARGDR
ncbi:hypothetical protein [Parafrankia sp. BMG5.11]|uniref:hypothetical protein n=1 Tax=Parafrankia sp. BMG5.11 TaxID=222540 RepID=UPI001038BF3E|nr:hypothetical protein [Parafrankia sp. BMG5.11]TCJ41290.1 hypothetical protein E0504_01370 [Parafrankia sp. BMG5.11]